MRIASIRPSTVDGIKQLAKKIKREQQLSYTDALEAASRQAGFENFVHARRQLSSSARMFPVYLSAHWQVRRGEQTLTGPWGGREVLRVDLSRSLLDVVAKHRVASGRGLSGFRMEYADHLEHRTDVAGLDGARETLLTAVRSLRFMDATGLQPVTTKKMRQEARELGQIPGRDHVSYWFEPGTESVLVLDEPYQNRIAPRTEERQRWLSARSIAIVSPDWEGIYFPGECPPHLISRDGGLLARVAAALGKTTPLAMPDPWPHPSAPNGEDFVSPQRQADAKPRQPRPGPSYRNYKGATPYGGAPGIRSRWRPSQSMLPKLHHRLGTLMQSLSEIDLSYRVGTKLSQQRSMLEDWMSVEHGAASTDGVYYGGPSRRHVVGRAERLNALAEAKAIVERGYNDCKPRRELIAALDAAATEIASSSTRNADVHR